VLFSERKLGYAQNFKLIVALLINTFIFLFMEVFFHARLYCASFSDAS